MPRLPALVSEPTVVLQAVSKTYGEAGGRHVVLDKVSASFRAGEFVALLGRSGSGKTTLLNLIAGIDAPTSGAVVVAGAPMSRLTDRRRTLFRRHHVGFVFQFFNLIPTLTAVENVQLPLELQGRKEAVARARAMLEAVGLANRAGAFADRLSGGEQQRVAIARALAGDPDLVLADEPTGNLDADTGATVLRLLASLSRERGGTLITATHSRAVASGADRVLRVEDGHLVPVEVATIAAPDSTPRGASAAAPGRPRLQAPPPPARPGD